MNEQESKVSAEFKAWLNDPRRLPPNTAGAVDHETGRVCVLVEDYAGSSLNGDAAAYWLTPSESDLDPWALVEGVDPRTDGQHFDVWFASGKCMTVAAGATLYLSASDAAKLVQQKTCATEAPAA